MHSVYYMSALRHLQISAGLPAPPSGHGSSTYSKVLTDRVHPDASLHPSLHVWSQSMAKEPFNGSLYWAAACLAFFGFFSLGEILQSNHPPLLLSDIATSTLTQPHR